jgi:hypothetical protein
MKTVGTEGLVSLTKTAVLPGILAGLRAIAMLNISALTGEGTQVILSAGSYDTIEVEGGCDNLDYVLYANQGCLLQVACGVAGNVIRSLSSHRDC